MRRFINCRLFWRWSSPGWPCAAHSAPACAACYGASDSPLAQGMNWGIFSLLAVVVCVLGGIASFFIFLAKEQRLRPRLLHRAG